MLYTRAQKVSKGITFSLLMIFGFVTLLFVAPARIPKLFFKNLQTLNNSNIINFAQADFSAASPPPPPPPPPPGPEGGGGGGAEGSCQGSDTQGCGDSS